VRPSTDGRSQIQRRIVQGEYQIRPLGIYRNGPLLLKREERRHANAPTGHGEKPQGLARRFTLVWPTRARARLGTHGGTHAQQVDRPVAPSAVSMSVSGAV
jgi:hypothetical protein